MSLSDLFRPSPAPAPAKPRQSWFARLLGRRRRVDATAPTAQDIVHLAALRAMPAASIGMDGAGSEGKLGFTGLRGADGIGTQEAVMGYFAGAAMPLSMYQLAQLSAHWAVDKACRIPARDAVRQGYVLDVEDEALEKRIRKADKRMRLDRNLQELVHMGRVFGIRILLFRVDSTEPRYYEMPFNPDGVTPGSYKGMRQVDPYWCEPELEPADMIDPTSAGFYEPTYWRIGGRRFHRSHLIIFRNGELPDYLKPVYRYGGVSVPQRIVERLYAAERSANEAPELAMTKRTTVVHMDLAEAQMSDVEENLADWVRYRNNYGVKMAGTDDAVEQFDTSLADFDALVMNQFQLVAGAANMPATKLLGTTPKGFNATGEYEEAAYHEELESIQTHDLTPAIDRHHLLLARSWGMPELEINHSWLALDTPTAAEYATIELTKAQRDVALQQTGALDAEDIRDRVRRDRDGDYYGLEAGQLEPLDPDPDDTLLS